MIYRLRYCNKDGVEARVDIQKGLATPVVEVEGTERPFILSYNNDKGDKSGMFLSSSADIEIYETPEFNIDNLKTSNETELSVTHYINNVISWQGFIIPDFFSIEVRNNPVITMTASDRLGTLKNVTLSDLPSMMSLRELAVLCLNKTGLELPLRTMADFNNGTGVNDFFNSKILTQRLLDTKGRSISCYDILSSILTASNSFLVQRTGAWHIINKIQHEAGSGSLYSDATTSTAWSDKTVNFSDVNVGARRKIIPVASMVGVYHEHGGGRLHPYNYDFSQGLTGWTAINGFNASIYDREILYYLNGNPYYGDTTDHNYLVNLNERVSGSLTLDTAPYLQSEAIPVVSTQGDMVDISLDINITAPGGGSNSSFPSFVRYAIIATNGSETYALNRAGTFDVYDATNLDHSQTVFIGSDVFGQITAVSKGQLIKGKLERDLSDYTITVRIYGSGTYQVTTVNFISVQFSNSLEVPKGTMYKREQGSNYTKTHEIQTVLWGDYLTNGLNGYFYEYPIDDTSSLYNASNELTSKWTAYNDPEQLPLLQHITRQKSRLFSVAHDLLSAEIEVSDFDPLAIFVSCGKRYTVVSAQFNFFKSNLSVELEEVAFPESVSARDFIYSYFGDGETGIKSIGGISAGAGGGGGTGGGLTPEQINMLADVSYLAHTHENKTEIDKIDAVVNSTDNTVLSDDNILTSLRVIEEILKNNETIKDLFLSKVDPDTAQEIITFLKGIIASGTSKFDNIEVGNYTTGPLGAGAAIKMENGVSRMEVDQLDVRMRATFRELIIESLKHIGGQLILSPARMKCTSVVNGGTYYRCYFDTGDGKVSNEFVAGDQARCQVFTGSGVKMYWRLVTSVGTDWINLSKTDAISGSSIPEAGDDIVQLGNRSDVTRQNAQILSTVGVDAPSWKQYKGINSFSLEGKDTTVFSGTGNKIDGKTVFVSSGSNIDDWANEAAQDIQDAQAAANAAALAAQQAIDDAAANVGLINTEVGKLQAQIDGEISNWFYPYSPTLANYPASDWTTNSIKDRHIGDTFTNTAQAPATDAGKSWRFVVNAGVYSWTQIADSDAVLALQKAAQAQSTADGKSTTYLIQPTSYKLGDMWVLAADQTVNGIAYKSGEILTATQDSATFNQAHWTKKVRYTDDTAVNNLQINSVNLLNNSCDFRESGWNGGWASNAGGYAIDGSVLWNGKPTLRTTVGTGLVHSWLKLENNVEYTYCAMVRTNEDVTWGSGFLPLHYHAGYNNQNQSKINVLKFDTNTLADKWKLIYIIFKLTGDADSFRPHIYRGSGSTVFNFAYIGLVKGNRPLLSPSLSESDKQKLSEQAQLAADGYMRARYVRDWAKGNTSNNWNAWNEIKVILKNGTNIAQGKPVTGRREALPSTPYTNVTDGNISTYSNPVSMLTPPEADWVQVDLGQIYYDIDYIQIWHYYDDGRTYYGTKTEISTDGVNWTPVFDSAKSGTYKETALGNIISFRPNEVLAKVLKGAAVTDTFKTTINGGLISTVITEYRELNSEQVTGLISGIQGANKNLPFLVAGGTYAEGIGGTAKAIIRHDGSVKFTEAEVEGRIIATSGEFTGKIQSNASGNRIEINPTERVFKMVANDIDVFKINFTPGSYPSAQITINSSGEAITEIWPAGLRATQLSGVKGYGHYHAGNMALGSTATSNAANFSVDVTQGSPTPYLDIYMRGLPTSSAGIAAGTVYRDASGYLRIV